MQFKSFHWLSHHDIGGIIPRSTYKVSGSQLFLLLLHVYFRTILKFNKTIIIIPLVLVENEMIIANSYPMHAHGVIVK